jgi:hypothetical protein
MSVYRVLNTAELLRLIFQILDKPTLTSTARVCREWYEVSLDYLYADIEQYTSLFGLLAPVVRFGHHLTVRLRPLSLLLTLLFVYQLFRFERLPTPNDWVQFE